MKLSTLIISTTLLGAVAWAQTLTIKQEGIGYIKMLGGTLKSELQAKMKEDPTGITAAKFCKERASSITKEINAKLPEYASVRRTALKIRNKDNKADATDDKVMNAYIKAIEEKKYSPKDAIKVVEEGGITRIYKPLFVQKACLKCHGTSVSPKIITLIKEGYPDDKAIDLFEGDLRGVIVAEIKKH
ncbi:MAG: hypothetical protein DRG30_03295 [Epsilonproteobacteria bacterium]|nr:MAG: hypothetical protein DRG30_03295 [Campylobacterota bacterium]